MTQTDKQAALDALDVLYGEALEFHTLGTEIRYNTVREFIDTAPQWQPIETAPRDGTPIDMWVEREHEHGEINYLRKCNVYWGKMVQSFSGDIYEGWIGLSDLYTKTTPLKWILPPQPPKGDENE